MKKRIYVNFLGLLGALASLLAIAAVIITYGAVNDIESAAIKSQASAFADVFNMSAGAEKYADYIGGDADSPRLTVISPEGTVLIDSRTDAGSLENHSDRAEVAAALKTGWGEATRYSSTVAARTYYCAVRLDDGNVLRVSKSIDSIRKSYPGLLIYFLLITALIFLIANYIANRLAANIVKPINRLRLDIDEAQGPAAGGAPANAQPADLQGRYGVYEELAPFVRKIDKQKSEINDQIAKLNERAAAMEAITGNMQEGLIMVDKSGYVLSANSSAAKIFNVPEMAGMNILHVCRDTAFQQGLKSCLAGGPLEIAGAFGGRTYTVYFSPARGGGANGGAATYGAIILLFDVTERTIAERQRREFTANVSHELKTPLSTILALSDMIEIGMVKEADIKGFAEKIGIQVKRLINIINDIIRLSEFDEGAVAADSESERFDLFELAESVKAALSEKAEEKRVAVKVGGERYETCAGRRMIDELLFNLLDNAIKYNKPGGRAEIELGRENGLCKITVADTGVGIAEEHHSRVFERFYRVDKSRSKSIEGTGLGLSIVKHIAMHAGGKVALSSSEGVGTTVTCYLDILAEK